MKYVALISCGKLKEDVATEARKLYKGALFKKSYEYAQKFSDDVWILSAKYGLLGDKTIVEPYEMTLTTGKNKKQRQFAWSKRTLEQIKEQYPNNDIRFIVFAGSAYTEYLVPMLQQNDYIVVDGFEGKKLPVGKRLKYLNERLCQKKIKS